MRCGDGVKKILVGYVSGVHGLRGDLKVKSHFSDSNKAFSIGNDIFLNDEVHKISNCKFYKGYYLITIDNLKDINLVEHYKGYDVYIDRNSLKLKPDEYILEDLIGLTILDNNKNRGVVKEILNNGVYNLLNVDYDKPYMIPLVDMYVKNVNIESGTIEVNDIEGLLL